MNADLMSTIAAIQKQTDRVSIGAVLRDAFGGYGFDRFMIAGLPVEGEDVRSAVLLSGWPEEWFERYMSQGYAQIDPVVRHCLNTTLPFAWSEAPVDPELAPQIAVLAREAAAYGLEDGICVPVHIEGGPRGGVSLSGRAQTVDEKSRLELHMLALYAHGQLRYLTDQLPQTRSITAREAEVLKWAATGKTAAEIAIITGLTERTVAQHCENAQRRLGTSNRVHTVVEAIRHKLIAI
ncbi:autoinducer binding domain-containing protein [Devosia sp. J2-20]|uniref:helix-turn-helix transcriptional regulator n=1 Tax=Devosia TaxID=46913 RepID=UPI0022AEE4BF|nr:MULTISPECIES: autoinducer binding domain-containing protein [Devosia]MCZ4346993.1 autoinducer binding domain-containing protein [Devosia neptuniae]WDR00709.1 autoinducer binding domain-containing protein [Devosia sp. J2-20]